MEGCVHLIAPLNPLRAFAPFSYIWMGLCSFFNSTFLNKINVKRGALTARNDLFCTFCESISEGRSP